MKKNKRRQRRKKKGEEGGGGEGEEEKKLKYKEANKTNPYTQLSFFFSNSNTRF